MTNVALKIEVNGNGRIISRFGLFRRNLGGNVGNIPVIENTVAACKGIELALGIGLSVKNDSVVKGIVYFKIVRDSVIDALTAGIANAAGAAEREEIIRASVSACAFNIGLFKGVGGVFGVFVAYACQTCVTGCLNIDRAHHKAAVNIGKAAVIAYAGNADIAIFISAGVFKVDVKVNDAVYY